MKPVFIHTISLFLFVILLAINIIIKTCFNFVLCNIMARGSAFVYFQIIGNE